MRRTVLVALLLVVSACGGGTADTTAAPAAASTVAPTTTTSTTTSTTTPPTTTTTTTTVPPWTTLSEPERPPVLLGGLADAPVENVCLGTTNEALIPPEEGLPRDGLVGLLSRFGLEVLESGEDCDATLEVVLSGRRTSANYETVGKCWSGVTLHMETSLLTDGQHRASWKATEEQSPPYSVSWCAEKDDPIDWDALRTFTRWGSLRCEPFAEMFGDLGAYLTCWSYHWESAVPPTEEDLAWLGFWAYRSPSSAATFINNNNLETSIYPSFPDEWWDLFLPLVPYLIGGDWHPGPSDHAAKSFHQRRVKALAAMTGVTFYSPEQAWEWWENHQP